MVRKGVDRGETHSLDYYVGYNRALIKLGEMLPGLCTSSDLPQSKVYKLYLAYTEYQIRNT